MTQDDLAALLKTSRTLVSAWERDETVPRGSTRLKIANALGGSNEWLRSGIGPRDISDDDEFVTLDQRNAVLQLVENYVIPAHDMTKQTLQIQGIDLGIDPMSRVIMDVAFRCMTGKREPTPDDVADAISRLMKGE